MTPNEQLLNIITKHYLNAQDNIAEADAVAIEAIHQYAKDYAKQMCDKQKLECAIQWAGIDNNDEDLNAKAILNAPYPKELI